MRGNSDQPCSRSCSASLVFVGVYAIGNPIDILISPEADEPERAHAIARLGLDYTPPADQ